MARNDIADISVRKVHDVTGSLEELDGRVLLVDRLWPRGVRKQDLPVDDWLQDAAPSPELRTWFGHDPAKWEEFTHRYRAELDRRPEALRPILDAARQGPVTLLYAARDPEHNHALVLRDYVLEALRDG